MTDRKYLPTFADLVDRLCITQMKAIFIPERQAEYVQEMSLIMHDVDLILTDQAKTIVASDVRAMLVLMLSNRFIWENETKARAGGPEQDKLLKLTHSINGVRNTAKNALAHIDGGRKDFKTDCFAAELVADFGNWNVFGVQNGEAKSVSGVNELPRVGECQPRDGLICRRAYPGDSACTTFGGKAKCIREGDISQSQNGNLAAELRRRGLLQDDPMDIIGH